MSAGGKLRGAGSAPIAGGRLIITDLDAHRHTFLREEHHDRATGFRRMDGQGWLEAAGLRAVTVEDAGED